MDCPVGLRKVEGSQEWWPVSTSATDVVTPDRLCDDFWIEAATFSQEFEEAPGELNQWDAICTLLAIEEPITESQKTLEW